MLSQPTRSQPLRVAVLVGSAREGRLAPAIAEWFARQTAAREDLAPDVIDVADHPLPASLSVQDPAAAALRPRLATAEAFVVIVPEYNRGVPGPLKTLIDSFNAEWEAKPVGFIGYGLSMAGGLRAIEHLRQVFAEFHCVGMKDIVSFPRVLDRFDADARFRPDEGAGAAAKLMLDQLTWWARALREAKARRPYGT